MAATKKTTAPPAPVKIKARSSVPKAELEHRWKTIRREMKERQLDVLIMQNASPIFGGYVRWFTDVHVHSHPTTVIFPLEDEMTLISHGPKQTPDSVPMGGPVHGIKKQLTLPFLNAYDYSSTWGAELAMTELKKYRSGLIGIVGPSFFGQPFYNYLTAKLKAARFENVSDWVDEIKAVKSEEELTDLRVTCQLQDFAFKYILTIVKPGRRPHEIRADIIAKWFELGGEQFNIGLDAGPYDTPARPQSPLADEPLKAGDHVELLFETSGPAGQWAEFCRTICIGKVSSQMKEKFAIAQEAQMVTLKAMKPGADPVALWDASNAFMSERGYPEERRIYAHGEGYDMMERPSLNPGETMKLKAGMNIAVHPSIKSPKATGRVCENYLVKSRGLPECLQKTEQKIYIV